jgi:hypothetical protein
MSTIADKLSINMVLFTKDGRKAGNGIIINTYTAHKGVDIIYIVKTDYGNESRLTASEIQEFYRLGRIDTTHKHAVK